jgi:hypothetical protein
MCFKQEKPSSQSSTTTHFLSSQTSGIHCQKVNLADSNIRSLVDAVLGRTLATSGRLLAVVVGTLVFLANVLDRLGASLCDGGSVAVVAVDADEVLAIGGLDVVDDDFSSTTVL